MDTANDLSKIKTKINIIKNISLFGLFFSFSKLILSFFTPFLSHYLKTEEFGTLAIYDGLMLIFSSIFTFGITSSFWMVYNKLESYEDKYNCIITTIIYLFISFSFALMLVLILINFSFYHQPHKQYLYLLKYSVIYSALQSINTILATVYQLHNETKKYITMLLLQDTILVIFTCLFILVFKINVNSVIYAGIISHTLVFMFCIYDFKLKLSIIKSHYIWSMLKVGVYFIPSALFMFFLSHLNRFVLSHWHGISNAGYFNYAFSVASFSNLLFISVETAWYPFFIHFRSAPHAFTPILKSCIRTYMMLGSIFILIFFIFSKPFTFLFVNSTFYQAFWMIGPIVIGFYFKTLYVLLLPPIYFSEKTKLTLKVQGYATLISVISTIYLIKHFGLYGAAYGFPIGYILMCINQAYVNTKTKYFNFLSELCKITLLMVFLFAVFIMYQYIFKHSIVTHVLLGLFLLCTLSVYLFAFIKEDINILKRHGVI